MGNISSQININDLTLALAKTKCQPNSIKNVKLKKPKHKLASLMSTLVSIGFRTMLLNKHKDLINDPLFEENYSNQDAIKTLWRQWSQNNENSQDKETSSCKAALKSVGFKYATTLALSRILEPIWDHYSPEAIIDIAIEYSLNKYKEYAPQIKHGYLFNNNNSNNNQVFQVYNVHKTAKHLNFPANHNTTSSATENLNLINTHFKKDNEELYFHATNWTSVMSICQEGVVHHAGRPCLDFGMKPGFYTTPSFEDSIEWTQKRSKLFKNESVILVFSVPQVPNTLTVKRFEKASREWSKLTKESRACMLKYNELDKYDFVYGPMMANIVNAIPHNPIKFQLASKSTKSDEFLDKQLVGIIWMQKVGPRRAAAP
jgi:hypothetical protein